MVWTIIIQDEVNERNSGCISVKMSSPDFYFGGMA